jgi:K+-transporting ATPase ATPase C chain
MAFITLVILGLAYPLVMTGLAQVIFPKQANGSLIRQGNRVIGSELIGQRFSRPEYFHPRPSAAGKGYDATASGGSNLGPTSRKLDAAVKANTRTAIQENPGLKLGHVPVDMVTASGSGLDPDISAANAYAQAARVAKARGISETRVRMLIRSHVTDRQFGVLGERRVNVLAINRALDAGPTGKR